MTHQELEETLKLIQQIRSTVGSRWQCTPLDTPLEKELWETLKKLDKVRDIISKGHEIVRSSSDKDVESPDRSKNGWHKDNDNR